MPLSPSFQRGRDAARVVVSVVLVLVGMASDTDRSSSSSSVAAQGRARELERLSLLGRANPQAAAPGLAALIEGLPPQSPLHLQALVQLGADEIALDHADEVERVARRIDQLAGRSPWARPAAMLLRARWLTAHGDTARAERLLIEAGALLPAGAPDNLREGVLAARGRIQQRAGHYDEALASYDAALAIADTSGSTWRRIDMRGTLSNMFTEAGQTDRALQYAAEEMSLAAAAHDELGLSHAWTDRANALSEGNDSAATLAAWRAALEHARLSGDARAVTVVYVDLADFYLSHGDYPTAYEMGAAALSMSQKLSHRSTEGAALTNMGAALVAMRRKDEGLALIQRGLAAMEQSNSLREEVEALNDAGKFLEGAGFLRDALRFDLRARQLSDDLDRKDRQRALIELQEGLDNLRRQHELDRLEQEGRIEDERLRNHELRMRQWTMAALVGLLAFAILATLARRQQVHGQKLRRHNELLREQAEIDPLTSLSNRHHLQRVMAQCHPEHLQGTVYLIDIDHFKRINDSRGHAAGDAVLAQVAQRLRSVLRDQDLVVRWGGEEFLIVVSRLSQAEAEFLGQRLLAALADAPLVVDHAPLAVTASIGHGSFPMASSDPRHGLELPWDRALAVVDAAMYVAKVRGRNRACSVRRIEAADAGSLAGIVQDLEAAERAGRVELHLQEGPATAAAEAPHGQEAGT